MSRRRLRGGCHCGAIRVALRTSEAALAPRSCQCSFCRRHGARTVSDPAGHVRVIVRDPSALVRYRFGRRAVDVLLCGRCGVYVGPLLAEGDAAWMTTNANTFDDPRAVEGPGAPVTYDAETDAERLARRKARWTPADVVTIARVRSDAPDAAALLAAYVAEIQRLVPGFDPAKSVSADPDEMVGPRGAFLVVRDGDRGIACGGLKTHAPGTGEIKRMYVAPEARARGVSRDLLEALEDEARGLGMRRVVLDTKIPEAATAVALYRSAGYVEVAPYNENPFANVWFAKDLGAW